jgi:hypothetical protein
MWGNTMMNTLYLQFQEKWEFLGNEAWRIAELTGIPKFTRFPNINVFDQRCLLLL